MNIGMERRLERRRNKVGGETTEAKGNRRKGAGGGGREKQIDKRCLERGEKNEGC